jgi:hypothetical protein
LEYLKEAIHRARETARMQPDEARAEILRVANEIAGADHLETQLIAAGYLPS